MTTSNRLMLLWQAAVQLEGSDLDKMIVDARNRRCQHLKQLRNGYQKLPLTTSGSRIRNPHNEVERSRRAHLRNCMDELKKKLIFNSECQLSRITMLNVLRKATSTIKTRERSIRALYRDECNIKNRNTQLKQRLSSMELQAAVLIKQFSMNEERRIRNYSECSVITTSSEESPVDDQLLRLRSLGMSKTSVNINIDDNNNRQKTNSICHSPISNSSDSSFYDVVNFYKNRYPLTSKVNKQIKH